MGDKMDEQTMKKALEATARVACCSFLMGTISCHAKKVSTEQAPSNAEAAEPVEVLPPAEEITEPVELLRPPTVEYPDQLMSCVQQVNKELLVDKSETPSEQAIGCCYQLAGHVLKMDGHLFNWELIDVCCYLMDDIRSACTPWGPPVPPTMVA